ncbi:MAG: glycerol-3-phosphate 1-O-acyltransferase PlsY [Candidatus Aminicenantaceae bacterium]
MKIIFLLFSYLLGSIPSGYILFRISDKKDIRDFGSGSTGATNLFRIKGWKWTLPAIIIDILKGALPVYLALRIFSDLRFSLLCAFLAVLGHCFPVYIKFRGGKGIATTMGAYAVLGFKPFLLSLATFLLVIAISRYVSLGSLLSTFFYPFFAFLFHKEGEIIILSALLFLIIALRHSGNIKRLIEGNERKLGEKVK